MRAEISTNEQQQKLTGNSKIWQQLRWWMTTRFTFRQLAAAAALLAVLPMQAQQGTIPDHTANAAGPAQANAAPMTSRVSTAGAPAFGPIAAAPGKAAIAPVKPVVQAATTPGPRPGLRIEPITGAPISTLAERGSGATEESPEQANDQESMLAGNGSVSDGAVHQGMKVHGHWVINISNPDGTLVQHREFENSLEGSAQGFMVGLLSGYMVPGDWMIVLGPQSGAGACNQTYEYCGLIHNAATFPAQGYCGIYYCTGSALSYAYNFGADFGGPFSIVLTGSITANQTGTIGTVYTLLNTCANIAFSTTTDPSSIETSSPSACVTQTNPSTWYGPFTDTNITPISVTDGQQIQAIVTITFS
jgi:hypothetical protein